jgi:hypothetical protein
MVKFLLLVGSSLFWIPVLLFILICVLSLIVIVSFILLFISTVFLLWLLKVIYRIQMDIFLVRQELISEIGNELNNISWWKLGKLTWKKYKKKMEIEKLERKLKENEKEIDYE